MGDGTFNWQCPHCNRHVTISRSRFSSHFHPLNIGNAEGDIGVKSTFLVCPNEACNQPTLTIGMYDWYNSDGDRIPIGEVRREWRLLPQGDARPFPSYVPEPIREDYREACLIRDLSPKSSATLARRALQGILRDFYQVKVPSGRLVDEIKSLKGVIDGSLWKAVNAVRQVGNIGAHMELDINQVVEVEPHEAQQLIGLVELMIAQTYVRRAEQDEQVEAVVALAAAKKQERLALKVVDGGVKG